MSQKCTVTSTPQTCPNSRNSSFATPRSAAVYSKPLGQCSSSKKLSAAFKSPVRQDNASSGPSAAGSAENESMEDLMNSIDSLKRKDAEITDQIQQLHDTGYREEELGEYIVSLHAYNEMKDIGQVLLGQIAVQRGITTRDLYKEYGLDVDD